MPYFSLNAFSLWLAAFVCLLATPAGAAPITYDMVTVGNAGNGTDTSGRPNTAGFGAVAYDYQIGKSDVTIGQYTAFLNAVAATDTNSLYNSSSAGISRTGESGSYTYSVFGSANRPINYVSWWDSARFSNWMANGQPTGAQSSTTTENGAYNVNGAMRGNAVAYNVNGEISGNAVVYDVNGAISGNAVAKNVTNPNTSAAPTFYIPTENEWYKAAYYVPTDNYGSGGYYIYSIQSLTAPRVDESDGSDNVFQWNDLDGAAGSSRGLRGGWSDVSFQITSSARFLFDPSFESNAVGFLLASPVSGPSGVPEIDPSGLSAVLGLLFGGLGLLERRRYGR